MEKALWWSSPCLIWLVDFLLSTNTVVWKYGWAPTFENFCVKYGKRGGRQWEGSWMHVSPEMFDLQASQIHSDVILRQFHLGWCVHMHVSLCQREQERKQPLWLKEGVVRACSVWTIVTEGRGSESVFCLIHPDNLVYIYALSARCSSVRLGLARCAARVWDLV